MPQSEGVPVVDTNLLLAFKAAIQLRIEQNEIILFLWNLFNDINFQILLYLEQIEF